MTDTDVDFLRAFAVDGGHTWGTDGIMDLTRRRAR